MKSTRGIVIAAAAAMSWGCAPASSSTTRPPETPPADANAICGDDQPIEVRSKIDAALSAQCFDALLRRTTQGVPVASVLIEPQGADTGELEQLGIAFR